MNKCLRQCKLGKLLMLQKLPRQYDAEAGEWSCQIPLFQLALEVNNAFSHISSQCIYEYLHLPLKYKS